MFDEILQYHRSNLTLHEKYVRLYDFLDRLCKQQTADYGSDFSNLFSRLYAICTHTGLKRGAIEHFRQHARRVIRGEALPDEEGYLYDLKALCEAVSFLYHTPIPASLVAVLPLEWRALPNVPQLEVVSNRIRMIADRWDEQYVYGFAEQDATTLLQVDYASIEAFSDLPSLLYPGAQLNLLTVKTDSTGILCPELIVLEPDYLIDISALAECMQQYGNHPANYMMAKFRPRETSHYILLGNAANQFLDDCVNEPSPLYDRSLKKIFLNDILAYSACQGIDAGYFERTKQQFQFIHETVKSVFNSPTCQIDKNGALLEPSFLCECMGLQGRMDFLQGDFRNLIELKSGKAEGYGSSLRPRESHALQMALYKEVLYYSLNVPRETVNSYLFYSQYPKLFSERSSRAQIQRAIHLRNRIVAMELQLKQDGGRSLWPHITPDTLNTRQENGRLWRDYQRPQIEAFLAPIQQADTITADYFYTFSAFVAREQFLAKMGDSRCDANHGFASTWNCDTPSKLSSGNMLVGLRIRELVMNEGIEKVILEIPLYDECFLPNFRKGDVVMLYERLSEEDNATNHQIIRGSVEEIQKECLTINLRNKQRNPVVFNRETTYAIEHDFMDSSFTHLYRGLYALLKAPVKRRELLLMQRQPSVDESVTLNGHYLNAQIDDIVLRAKQARDYFLLVGPPGTGKTSIALQSMVREFHSIPQANILLLSYTNRAVDEICEMLESISPLLPYVRIGNELSCEERFRHRLLKRVMDDCHRRSEVIRKFEGIRIVAGTVASINANPELFDLKHFDVAIIDEASQILEPQIMGILCAGRSGECAIDKFILVGDHKQLPAVVGQRNEDSTVNLPSLHAIGLTDCRNSLFERLYAHPASLGVRATLNRQGRMHPDISAFANINFYAGNLDIVPVPHQCTPLEWKNFDTDNRDEACVATTRLGFIDTPYPPVEDSVKVNRHEAEQAARLVACIYTLCKQNGLPFEAARRIGIIVPFRNQISLIANKLHSLGIPEVDEITIDTVERYQGSQRDIIIYSTTISRPYQLDTLSVPVVADGLSVDRKLNVALTRARKQLFVIGNADLLGRNPIYGHFIRFVKEHGRFEHHSPL